jgi:hypothetical protein
MLIFHTKNYAHVYLHILCAHTNFRKKHTFSVGCATREKSSLTKMFILTPIFIFLHRLHTKNLVFLNRLGDQVGCEGLHATFFF